MYGGVDFFFYGELDNLAADVIFPTRYDRSRDLVIGFQIDSGICAGCEDVTACATLKTCALDRKHGSPYASVVH